MARKTKKQKQIEHNVNNINDHPEKEKLFDMLNFLTNLCNELGNERFQGAKVDRTFYIDEIKVTISYTGKRNK